jgi:hypothetical protein
MSLETDVFLVVGNLGHLGAKFGIFVKLVLHDRAEVANVVFCGTAESLSVTKDRQHFEKTEVAS